MSEALILTEPLQLSEFAPQAYDPLYEFSFRHGCTDMTRQVPKIYFSLWQYPDGTTKLNQPRSTEPLVNVIPTEEAAELMKPLTEHGQGWLHENAPKKLVFTAGAVLGGHSLRMPFWHFDEVTDADLKAVLVSSQDGTDFAVGSIANSLKTPYEFARQKAVSDPAAQQFLSNLIDRSIGDKRLRLVPTGGGQVIGIDNSHAHRSDPNERSYAISKAFASLVTVARTTD